jgi:hypothetical protein
MKLGLGISIALVMFALSIFTYAPYVYSADSTATPTPSEIDTPAEEATVVPSDTEGYEMIADKFFDTLATQGGEAAVRYSFSTNPYASRLEAQIDVAVNQFMATEGIIGEYIDRELLVETKVADHLVVQYYLVMYERQPMKFELTFYKPYDEWIFQNFVFNSSIVEEVSALTRLSIMESDKVEFQPQRIHSVLDELARID